MSSRMVAWIGEHIAAAALVLLVLAAVLIAAVPGGSHTPPDPALCDALRAQSVRTPDAVYAMEERGCPDPPYERLSSPAPGVLGRPSDGGGAHG